MREFLYTGSDGKPTKPEDMHSARLVNAAAKMRRDGHPDGELIDHMEAVAHRKEREWHDGEPEKFQEWATKNPEKAVDFHQRHGTTPKGAA